MGRSNSLTAEKANGPVAPRVVMRAIADLVPYQKNARTHSPEQIKQIARSIQEFGFTNPVLIDASGGIIAGHGRVEAARELGMTTVPCIGLEYLSEEQVRAYIIADNRIALSAGWSEELLRLELSDLKLGGYDLSLTGFGVNEIAQLFASDTDPTIEWAGMPTFDQQDKMAWRTIKVHFRDQSGIDSFSKLIGQRISERTRFAWFPIEAAGEKSLK